MTKDKKKALLLAGKMARAAHAVVCGSDIYNIGENVLVLRDRLNDYNSHVYDMTRRKNAAS